MTENTTLHVTHPSPAVVVVWEIKDFFELPAENDYMLESTTFELLGAKWILQIYPNKKLLPPRKQVEWISLFVKMKPCSLNVKAAFTLSIKRADGSVFKSLDTTNVFNKESSSWGWYEFCQRSTLLESRDVIAPRGTLTVSCKVCIQSDNAESDASDECFILTSELDGYKRKIQALEEKLSTAEKELDASRKEMKDLQNDEETLSQHFKELYLSAYQADITISVKEKIFRSHKSVLAARSSVFRAMFDADMAEKRRESVNIDDCEPETFECFLLFLYSGKLDGSSSTPTTKLYSVADKYDVKKLKDICRKRLFLEVSVESVCDIVSLAVLHEEHELLEISTEFFISNANAIVKTSKWLSFLQENPLVANELLIKMTERVTK